MTEFTIAQRWEALVHRVATAAVKSARPSTAIQIIGVTKYVDAGLARQLYEAGCRDFGESRPQSLWAKAEELVELPVRWHLVGHLQRNKVRRTLPLVDCIHSVDSLRLAQQIDLDAGQLGQTARILLEVNTSGDASKTGMTEGMILTQAASIVALPNLRVVGLMGMAGLSNGEPRSDFAAVRQLRDRLRQELGPEHPLDELSMGMSGDFEAAISEGATMVRIGSVLFPDEG